MNTNAMEQPRNNEEGGVEIKKSEMESIVSQLQTFEKALAQFKVDQDNLRNLPDRGEKNALLAEIEESIRATSAMINTLQSQKMELLQAAEKAGDEKYITTPTRTPRTEGPMDDNDLTTIRLNRD